MSKMDSLLCRDVALSYGCAVHFSHLHVALDLSEVQAQVLTTDGHECAALSRTAKWGDLQESHTNCIYSLMQMMDEDSSWGNEICPSTDTGKLEEINLKFALLWLISSVPRCRWGGSHNTSLTPFLFFWPANACTQTHTYHGGQPRWMDVRDRHRLVCSYLSLPNASPMCCRQQPLMVLCHLPPEK